MPEKLKDLFAKNWKPYAIWGATVVCLFALWKLGYLETFSPPQPPIPIFDPRFDMADGGKNFGWHRDDGEVQAVAGQLRFKVFADTPAGQVAAVPDHFYQWTVYRKADPRGPPSKNQGSVGSCVSFGTNNAILRTMACQIVLNGAAEELKDIVEEVTYAGSRVEIGGGRIRGDGSIGAWAAKFVQQYGVIARGVHLDGKYDLTKYDLARCRQWGDKGVPDDLEGVVREHFVKEITLIKTLDELKKALSQGYGVAVCSGQGFSMQRDSRGVARPSGSWAHCMCIDGFHTDGGKEYYHIENSWGPSAHSGPVGWGDPSTAGFWAEASVVQRMLNAGDTWAFSGVKGFPAREPEWFVHDKHTEPVRLALLQRSETCFASLFLLCP